MPEEGCNILISACLLGERVRYDAQINKLKHCMIDNWLAQGCLLSCCPEVCGGLATPRPAAEIQKDGSIKTEAGEDVSGAFKKGALKTLQLALENNIKIAILTEKSPSCGSSQIYNGRFERRLINGKGLTTQLLEAHGIKVFNQFQLAQIPTYLNSLK
ncbi:DUF523 domain-containing protein [Psychromonas antarctica]|uniref:DUF523 domain-containing protein n=1 Tax=Psychromonas antarctica TaxID=67573 RepID=UPI001EE7BE84|nr:DUF523 domain-containing protein [Psychromonas antarctica]MCG6200060.1 DUF523 domain-containing protein [Psychromonas antarctica]